MRRTVGLRKSADFVDVRKRGRRVSDGLIAFGVVPADGDTTRFGLTVSKRVGGAVTRNRVKRRLRECLTSLDFAPGYNIVLSARPATAEADYHMLLGSVTRLARRAGVLSPETVKRGSADPDGTSRQGAATQRAATRRPAEGKKV